MYATVSYRVGHGVITASQNAFKGIGREIAALSVLPAIVTMLFMHACGNSAALSQRSRKLHR